MALIGCADLRLSGLFDNETTLTGEIVAGFTLFG